MTRTLHLAVLICALALLAQIAVLWNETGRAGLTRYYDAERAARERETAALSAVFDAAGAPAAPLVPEVPNSFALGLFPFGFDRYLVSVTSLALPAVAVAVAALIGVRRGRQTGARTSDKV